MQLEEKLKYVQGETKEHGEMLSVTWSALLSPTVYVIVGSFIQLSIDLFPELITPLFWR